MYEATSVEQLEQLVQEENIRYIIVDKDCRDSTLFEVREEIIASAYEVVYTEGEGEWKTSIYDVTKKVK